MELTQLEQVLDQAQRLRATFVHADTDGKLSGYFTSDGDFVMYKPQQPGEFGPPMPIGIVSRIVVG